MAARARWRARARGCVRTRCGLTSSRRNISAIEPNWRGRSGPAAPRSSSSTCRRSAALRSYALPRLSAAPAEKEPCDAGRGGGGGMSLGSRLTVGGSSSNRRRPLRSGGETFSSPCAPAPVSPQPTPHKERCAAQHRCSAGHSLALWRSAHACCRIGRRLRRGRVCASVVASQRAHHGQPLRRASPATRRSRSCRISRLPMAPEPVAACLHECGARRCAAARRAAPRGLPPDIWRPPLQGTPTDLYHSWTARYACVLDTLSQNTRVK